MKIEELLSRLNTSDKVDKIIEKYIYAFYYARDNNPGYEFFEEGKGIAYLGNYEPQQFYNVEDPKRIETELQELMGYIFVNFYASENPTVKEIDAFGERVYSKENYYTFDTAYRYSIDSNDELKKQLEDIDTIPDLLVLKTNLLKEKEYTFYKSHLFTLNIKPEYRAKFVQILFDQVNELHKTRIEANEKLDRNRPLTRIRVQIPRQCNIRLNEKDSVAIMCNTRDLEDVLNLINITFDEMGSDLEECRGVPNPLLANPYDYLGYDSYDLDLRRWESEIIGEVVIKALDLVIAKNKKIIPSDLSKDNMIEYRQKCLKALLLSNKKYLKEIIDTTKKIMKQFLFTNWSYDIDENMMFVSPSFKKPLEVFYGKNRKYKVISSKKLNTLDNEISKSVKKR